jgi:hypothetical protein
LEDALHKYGAGVAGAIFGADHVPACHPPPERVEGATAGARMSAMDGTVVVTMRPHAVGGVSRLLDTDAARWGCGVCAGVGWWVWVDAVVTAPAKVRGCPCAPVPAAAAGGRD